MKKCSFLHLFFPLLGCLCLNNPVSAQMALEKGYYLHRPDSARVDGYFDFSLNDFNTIGFYEKENGPKTRELHPGDVWAIVGEKGGLVLPYTLRSKNVVNEIFAVRILESEVSLFEGRIDEKENAYFVSSPTLPRLTRVAKYNPDVFFKVYLGEPCAPRQKVRHTKSSLLHVLKEYAKCMGKEVAEPAKHPFKINLALGARVGLVYSKAKVSGFYGNAFEQEIGPVLGGDIQIALSKRLVARLGFAYVQSSYLKPAGTDFNIRFKGPTITYSEPLQFSFNSFEIPLELIWMWNKSKRVSGFVGLGGFFLKTRPLGFDQEFTRPDNHQPHYSFSPEQVTRYVSGSLFDTPWIFAAPQVKTGLLFRFKNASFLELGIRHKTQKERIGFQNKRKDSFSIFVSNRQWFDFSLAFYVPLTKRR